MSEEQATGKNCLLRVFLIYAVAITIGCGTVLQGLRLSNLYVGAKPEEPKPEEPKPCTKTKAERQGRVAICTTVKDEEAYIDEWADYHLALGFDMIYLYDNSDRFEMRQWAAERGCHVNPLHFPGSGRQFEAMRECGKRAYDDGYTWAGFFDVDEFLVLKKHRNVVDLLNEHGQIPGSLGINWHMFGSSDRLVYSPIPVTKRFLYRTPRNDHVKNIIRLEDMNLKENPVNAHFPRLIHGTQYDTTGSRFGGHLNARNPTNVAVFHHYHTKSRKEYIQKRFRGRASAGKNYTGVGNHIRQAVSGNIPNGTIFDDSAWKALKRLQPKYAVFDEELMQ